MRRAKRRWAAPRLDRDGDQPAGALLGRLPQCGERIGTSGGERERALEWNLSRDEPGLCHGCVAGRCAGLNAPSCGLNAQVVVRTVKLSYKASVPDVVRYEVSFRE